MFLIASYHSEASWIYDVRIQQTCDFTVSLKGFNVYEWINEGFSVETAATDGYCQMFQWEVNGFYACNMYTSTANAQSLIFLPQSFIQPIHMEEAFPR